MVWLGIYKLNLIYIKMGNFTKYFSEDDKVTYWMLYTFLKEQGILSNYIQNIIKTKRIEGEIFAKGTRSILMHLVIEHSKQSWTRENIFNFAPTSFFWARSIEGDDFWKPYYPKWCDFYCKHKHKLKQENL